MRRLLPALLLLAALPVSANLKWNDTLRDVYVHGTLTREGQTLVNEHRLAYLPPSGDAWIFDRDTRELSSADRALFALNEDRTAATTPDTFPTRRLGTFAMPDDSSYLGNDVLIYPHQSHAGPMSEEALWATAPVWKSIHDHYTPDAAVVEKLRAAKPARVTIVFATWCGDSKRAVPRLLKALHEANNPLLQVELYGIGPEFFSPLEYVRDQRLTNVPTMIVERGRNEIGRVVETPVTATVEQDIAMMLAGETLPAHPGRYERKALLASGRYAHRNARGETATETWELWETKDGGLLAHSLIVKDRPSPGASRHPLPAQRGEGSSTIETFAGLDAQRAPDFAEVTRRDGDHVVRTRAYGDKAKWTVRARGDERGLVEQTCCPPKALLLPATLTFGWPLFNGDGEIDALVMDANGPIGAVETARVAKRTVTARTIAYTVRADSALHVPVSVKLADGSERRLLDMKGTLPRALPAANRQ
jgi:hypothetical protein